jgi:hypothetical protein
MLLTPSQNTARRKILDYLKMPTRGGCFYLIGDYLSGKTFLLKQLAQDLLPNEPNAVVNVNLFLAERVLKEPDYPVLAQLTRPNSDSTPPKLKQYFRDYLTALLDDERNYHPLTRDGRTVHLLCLDHVEMLYEYDIGLVTLLDAHSATRTFEKKIVAAIPGRVAQNMIYAFHRLPFPIPAFSQSFWAELNREELRLYV